MYICNDAIYGWDDPCIDEMMHMAWCVGYDVLDDVQCMMYNDSAHGYAHGVHMGIWSIYAFYEVYVRLISYVFFSGFTVPPLGQ